VLDAMDESLRDFATVATRGTTPIPLLMGRCVGGSTAVNSGIIWRLPEDVQRQWTAEHGLGEWFENAALERCFEAIERDLGVATVRDEVIGGNGARLRAGSEALALPGQVMRRNAGQCRGSGRCLQGCPNGARQSMDVSYIPDAMRHGARVHALTRAARVLIESGRAVGVIGRTLDPHTREPNDAFEVRARRGVIVACGAVYSPVLLWQSGVRGGVGRNFQAHPGVAVVGKFRERIGMGTGATQTYEVPLRERGYKLESLALPPELLAVRLPGAGAEWQAQLEHLGDYGQFCAVHRSEARGSVRPGFFGGVHIRYDVTPRDLERIKESLALLTRVMFAAGAVEVYPGVAGIPERLGDPAQAELITASTVRRGAFHLLASHHFGTAAAGGDAKRSVLAPSLETHAVRGLYVMDASALPTNLGVNPQHTIMALARIFATSALQR
jgi:choline dehydrogenase-like flavoprotein